MGLYLYKSGTVKSVPYSKNGRIVSAPTFLSAAFGVKNRMFAKTVDKKTATLLCEMLLFRWDFIFFFKNQRRLSLLQGEVTFGFSSTFAEEESSSSIFSESGIALWQRGQR